MAAPEPMPESPELLKRIYDLFRDFFDRSERKRRWSIRDDIPWDQCNPALNPAIADVVETFCAVELYLPDYLSKTIPQVRNHRGRAWFFANWGYEESKHALALETWLLESGNRTYDEIRGFEETILSREWDLTYEDPLDMMLYTSFQEFATGLNYRGLRRVAGSCGLYHSMSFCW